MDVSCACFSMHETGHSKLVYWDNREEWDEEGDGKGIRDGGHVYTCRWFMSTYGKKYYNIVK